MGKGRFLKSAERACASKARFDTAEEAVAYAEGKFRAYPCPVCHYYHLTSRSGQTIQLPEPAPPPPPAPGPKLADLDWSKAFEQSPPKRKPSEHNRPAPRIQPKPAAPDRKRATFLSLGTKDHRAHLSVDGRLVKSKRITDRRLLLELKPGVQVEIDDAPHPTVLRILL